MIFLLLLLPVNTYLKQGCCHCSVDSTAPSILPLRVRVPTTPSRLISFQIKICTIFVCALWKRMEINKKRPNLAHLKNRTSAMFLLMPLFTFVCSMHCYWYRIVQRVECGIVGQPEMATTPNLSSNIYLCYNCVEK